MSRFHQHLREDLSDPEFAAALDLKELDAANGSNQEQAIVAAEVEGAGVLRQRKGEAEITQYRLGSSPGGKGGDGFIARLERWIELCGSGEQFERR